MSAATTVEQSRIGSTVAGRYKLVRVLGRGGMGMVYEAELVGSHRHVAIKVMHPESQADGDNVRRFVNEFVGEEDIRFLDNLQTPVAERDEISIVPAVAGG